MKAKQMAKKNYYSEIAGEKNVAKAILKNRHASLKYSTEIAREIKGMRLDKAEAFLKRIASKQEFLPLRRYSTKGAHRKGDARSFTKAGRYPGKTAGCFLDLLENVKANADYKGMDAENLLIASVFASQGYARRSHQKQGNISGKSYKRKSAHLEIVVREAR